MKRMLPLLLVLLMLFSVVCAPVAYAADLPSAERNNEEIEIDPEDVPLIDLPTGGEEDIPVVEPPLAGGPEGGNSSPTYVWAAAAGVAVAAGAGIFFLFIKRRDKEES